MKSAVVSLFATLFVVLLIDTHVRAGDGHAEHGASAANRVCPVSGEAIESDAEVVRYRGRDIKLCCKACSKDWARLSDAQRDAKLAAVKRPREAGGKALTIADVYPFADCPVSGKPLGSMGKPIIRRYDGREIRFCCAGCIKRFEKEKPGSLAKLDKRLIAAQRSGYPLTTCVVSGGKLGSMGDPVDRVVGNRLVRLCCAGCVSKLKANRALYLAKLDAAVVRKQAAAYSLKSCIVSGKPLDAMGGAKDVVVAGRLVRLCCAGCLSSLRQEPASYLTRLDAALKSDSTDRPAEKHEPDGHGHKKHDHD